MCITVRKRNISEIAKKISSYVYQYSTSSTRKLEWICLE